MQVKRLQGVFSWLVVLSELSHVFCCVLPSIFSLLTVMIGMGIFSTMPSWMDGVHSTLHDWELPVIAFSGVALILGWGAHMLSKRLDCHGTGCMHEPCEPKKDKNASILQIATFLFVVNVSIYSFIHLPQKYVGNADVGSQQTELDHSHH